jgi:subfamily B ATP-binding cassette protein MsbA
VNIVYHQAVAGAGRIFELMDQEPEKMSAPDASPMPPIEGRIEFKDVSFSYGQDGPVLSGISFKAEPGERVAILGPSGAGKSTIAGLIPRFWEISGGQILIDGMDIRRATLSSLRRHIATVPQETVLFGTSIRENIAYGRPDATPEEIKEAAKAANADTFIRKLPQEYDTLVGERGSRLSGGERQRIAIARALLKDPRLLILDEATSSLDLASESLVQEALERLMRGRTTLVIAHRLSAVKDSDLILVIDGGRVVESGMHQDLLHAGGLYARLWQIENKDGAK